MGNELTKFACSDCKREYLPCSEFSDAQVEKCEVQERKNQEEAVIRLLVATCKACVAKAKEAEAARAAERAAEAKAVAAEVTWERVVVTLEARPFGMTPASSSEGGAAGYRVAKASEGKPAWAQGVRPGWALACVGEQDVSGLPLAEAQAALKEAALPAELAFDVPPAGWHFCVGCCAAQPPEAFSRKMLTKPPEKRRCSECVQVQEP
ncbi:unnamed protein product [Prorocentrum cordatum]|uniref:PDZ domain-containing protein n=1 Tax=Prorocentrum cordatum TaxID=2364126 RepID=A0ABN9T0J7_9DINO|nr:unnamed protein product [Polarella glacialis]